MLEGSRLGGRVLVRRARAGEPGVRAATAYLAHGEGRRFWPTFLTRLERTAEDPDAVVEGAHRAFAVFEAALGAPTPEIAAA